MAGLALQCRRAELLGAQWLSAASRSETQPLTSCHPESLRILGEGVREREEELVFALLAHLPCWGSGGTL